VELIAIAIFEGLCTEHGLDPNSLYPQGWLIPRQRRGDTSPVRVTEPDPKVEEESLPPGWTRASGTGIVLGDGNATDPGTEEDIIMIDNTTAVRAIETAKNADVTVTVQLTDGSTITGAPVSVNSKGVNLKIDGKTRSFGLRRIDAVKADIPATDDGEALSTREVAEIFNIEAKELRVHLRSLGRGVGKGRKYGLTTDDVNALRTYIDSLDAEDTPANA